MKLTNLVALTVLFLAASSITRWVGAWDGGGWVAVAAGAAAVAAFGWPLLRWLKFPPIALGCPVCMKATDLWVQEREDGRLCRCGGCGAPFLIVGDWVPLLGVKVLAYPKRITALVLDPESGEVIETKVAKRPQFVVRWKAGPAADGSSAGSDPHPDAG